MTFIFLGTVRAGLTERSPFYAWSALTRAGETVAWDYAPDAAWLGIPGAVAGPTAIPMPSGYAAPRFP